MLQGPPPKGLRLQPLPALQALLQPLPLLQALLRSLPLHQALHHPPVRQGLSLQTFRNPCLLHTEQDLS